MPVYNGGEYLSLAIQSILSQSHRDFELLIVNDCSTDNSMDTIQSFRDSRIVVHTNPENLGQTKSLNIGLRKAQGQYVARMDADDIASNPAWLERLLKYAAKHPEYAVVGSAAFVVNDKGNKKEIRRMPLKRHEIIFRIFFAPPMNHVSVLLQRDLILKNGGYDEDFRITQDYELWSSLIRNNFALSNIPDVLVSYRVHKNSIGSIEADKKGLAEKSETIFRNIQALTDLALTHEEATRICKLFYHPMDLNPGQFEQAQRNFESIYANLKKEWRVSEDFIRRAIRHEMLKPYCKLAASQTAKSPKETRRIVSEYRRRYGFHWMPALIFLITFSGARLSRRLPYLFEKWREMTTRLSLT